MDSLSKVIGGIFLASLVGSVIFRIVDGTWAMLGIVIVSWVVLGYVAVCCRGAGQNGGSHDRGTEDSYRPQGRRGRRRRRRGRPGN
jgi:hypothetical protein